MASTAKESSAAIAESTSSSDPAVEAKSEAEASGLAEAPPFKPTARFWAIIFTCAVIGLLSALENTVVTTALPQVAAELDLQANYIWVTNAFFLTGLVTIPSLSSL